jgi:hypothetical protein
MLILKQDGTPQLQEDEKCMLTVPNVEWNANEQTQGNGDCYITTK